MSHLAGTLNQSQKQERLREMNTESVLQLIKGNHNRVSEQNIWAEGEESNPKSVLFVNGFNKAK